MARMMASESRNRALIAAQLGVETGDVDEVALVDLALALGKALGIVLPRDRLLSLGTYGDLLRVLRDTLEDDAQHGGERLAAFFVRVRIVSGGADGRVAVVRVGWLTPDLAAAIADDLRNAPLGAWLDVLVPDDLDDDALASLTARLRQLVGTRARLSVRRGGVSGPALGPIATLACDRLPHRGADAQSAPHAGRSIAAGTGLAEYKEHPRCTNQRRSE